MKEWQRGEFFTEEFIGDNSWNGYEHDILMRNDHDGQTFTDIAHAVGIDLTTDGRGVTYLDYDQDGDLDVVVVGHRQQAVFLRNDVGDQNHWIQVKLVGSRSNRQAVGARLTLRAGGKQQMREVRAGGGYLQSQSVPEAFGLGAATSVDELTIRWPSGTVQSLRDLPAGQVLEVIEPSD